MPAMFTGSVHKTPKELAEMQMLIDQGKLPRDAIEQYYENEFMAVYGENYKTDKNGEPIEQGIGSKSQPSPNSIAAYIKTQTQYRKNGPEPGYDEHLARMEAELAAFNAGRGRKKPGPKPRPRAA
jgi:phage repressor protein C with HTH and peptisase S24 domain